ncbi:MAG: hypothetical protein AB7F89_11405 [Pirellulaceae bacterium]
MTGTFVMRPTGLGVTLAVIAIWTGFTGAQAQPPAAGSPAGGAGSSLRDWFTDATRGLTGSQPASAANVPAHYLRQTTCNIPFTMDASQDAPVELQLFVSTDQGQRWMFFSRANPNAGSFSFRATQDGEYWFALKTIDKSPAPLDPRSLQPGLKVIFDTQSPQLDLQASPQAPGVVSVRWDVRDSYLDAETLRLEYQAESQGPWQTLSVPQSSTNSVGQLAGQQLFRLDGTPVSVLLRAEVRDKAGNNAVASRHVDMYGATGNSAGTTAVSARNDVAEGTSRGARDGSVTWPRDNEMPQRVPPPATYGELPPPKPSSEFPPGQLGRELQRNPFIAAAAPGRGTIPPSTASPEEVAPGPGEAFIAADRDPRTPTPPADIPYADDGLQPNGTAPGVEPFTSGFAGDDGARTPESSVTLPGGDRPRMTNSREFSLDYEVEALGPATIRTVELWGTSDGGRTWTRWQNDDDRQSPVDVQVDRDGVFGFRIVIVSARQLSGLKPQPGEPADIWIGVDTTPPTVRITAVPYGDGDHAGQFDIRWQAFDTGFGDRPITLSFSEYRDGPWNILAAGLPNSGQYYWAVEPRIPREIYLRLEAQDDAGNVGEHRLSEPIKTAGLIPHAKIRGFRVPGSTNRSAARTPATR